MNKFYNLYSGILLGLTVSIWVLLFKHGSIQRFDTHQWIVLILLSVLAVIIIFTLQYARHSEQKGKTKERLESIMNRGWVKELKVGDKVIRAFIGQRMPMKVTAIDTFITVTVDEPEEVTQAKLKRANDLLIKAKFIQEHEVPDLSLPYWTFHRETGMEVDEELEWDGVNKTGSYLIKYDSKLN